MNDVVWAYQEETRVDDSRVKCANTAPGRPLVTIVTSTYNAAKYLPQAIRSVREQRYGNIEWIVVDGASTDGTLDLIRDSGDVIRSWISEADKGIYDAWNKGLQLAQGEWVLFLGADDQLLPDAIESMLKVADESPVTLDLITGKTGLYSGEIKRRTVGKPWEWERFRKYMCVAHVGAMHHVSYFSRYGHFDNTFRIAGDYEMLLRAGAGLRAGFVDDEIARVQVGGASNQKAVFMETFRARLRHGACTYPTGMMDAGWAWFKWNVRRLIRY